MELRDILSDKLFAMNQDNIDELREKINKSGSERIPWAFCLGAGVSISCGLPNWTKLLAMISGQILTSYLPERTKGNNLLEAMIDMIDNIEKNDDFNKKLQEAADGGAIDIYGGIDPLELAEYIRTQIKEMIQSGGNAEEEIIDEALRTHIRNCYKIEREPDGKIKGYADSTLEAIVEIMEKKGIKRAITYNYDDLLEIAFRQSGKNVEAIVPGERKEFAECDDTFRIYHCHGLVCIDSKDDHNSKKIILTESSYYNEESNKYSLANVLQAYAMNYCNLLYVGFSGADYTFRRIIRGLNRAENKAGHYIFFCADDVFNMVYNSRADKKIEKDEFIEQIKNKKCEYERLMINQILVSKTLYWKEKGMNVIWSTQEELAGLLKGL